MAFKINDEAWTPQSVAEHAATILDTLNSLLQENNIQDEDGNIIQLSANFANAMYLLILANANKNADMDAVLQGAINSFNIAICDDSQIENLLPIAAVSRNPGSYGTLNITVTASDDGDAIIPAGSKLPYNDVNFITTAEAIVPAGTSQILATVCDTIGPITVLTGEIKSFENTIANVDEVTNYESSVPGVAAETTTELRQRLLMGNTIKYTLEGCKSALEELTGISYARVYFNYNTTEAITLPGGVELQPRHAYIVVQGESADLAATYAEYMNAPTQNSPIAAGKASTVELTIKATADGACTVPVGTECKYLGYTFTTDESVTVEADDIGYVNATCTVIGPVEVPAGGISEFETEIENLEYVENENSAEEGYDNPAHSQEWNTTSGQAIPIYYDSATAKKIYIKIVLKASSEVGSQVENQIKRDLITAAAGWRIGETITTLLVSEPFINCTYAEIAYTQVSENGETWTNLVETGCNVIPRVKDNSIIVEQLDE